MQTKLTRRKFLTRGAAATALTGFGLGACAPGGAATPPPPATATPFIVPTPSLPSPVEQVSVRILWTGDAHGQLRPVYHREPFEASFLKAYGLEPGSVEAYLTSQVDFAALAGQYGPVGGYAHLATLIAQERAALPERTLLLDSGDAWYGSAIAMLTGGKACVEVMNAIGYDAMTLHWEFNLGQDTMLARVDEAQFPVLAQNLVDTDFEDRVLQPSLLKDLGGVRVAVVGQAYPFSLLTTEDREATPGWRMGFREDKLQEEIDRVRQEEGAELVIVLSHMGYLQDRALAEMLTGIDVIVGGHTHDILWQPDQVGRTLIVQAGSHGKFLGELDLEVRNGKVVAFQHRLLPVLAERIEPDARIEELLTRLYRPYQDELGRVIGETRSVLYRRSLFGGTTDALVTAAYREIMGADLGCAGGWRFGVTLLPGPITVEDVYNAMKPTPSPLYKASLKGELIRRLLEDNLDNVFNPDPLLRLGGDTLRCAGIRAGLRKEAPREERTVDVMVNDEPLDPERVYQVATSGGRTQNLDPESEATSRPAVEELLRFIEANSPISMDQPIRTFTEVS